MDHKRVFIIAEAGVNHNGDLALALKLVDAAKESGADAIKFQTFVTEEIVTKTADMATYQKSNLGAEHGSQFEMLKKLELSYEDFRRLCDYCQQVGIEFLSTPDEAQSLDFLTDELQVSRLKVGSGDLDNLEFLKLVAQKQKPIILSTGMGTLEEVRAAVDTIKGFNRQPLTLLHCTSSYPCPMEDVNLNALCTLMTTFSGLQFGYSDHTIGMEIPIAALAMGASVIEKHFTLDREMPGPDHVASMTPREFAAMVAALRNVERAMGDGVKQPTSAELEVKLVVRKRIVAARSLAKGRPLELNDFRFKRAPSGISVSCAQSLVGRVLVQAISVDTPIEWAMVLPLQAAGGT